MCAPLLLLLSQEQAWSPLSTCCSTLHLKRWYLLLLSPFHRIKHLRVYEGEKVCMALRILSVSRFKYLDVMLMKHFLVFPRCTIYLFKVKFINCIYLIS